MRWFNACVSLTLGMVLQDCTTATMPFSILRAFLSPPMPRVTRIRNINAREIGQNDPFAVYDFLVLVNRHNYPAEEHNVTTLDGYKLVLHRIPGSPISPPAKKKPIVLLQHGFLASSDSFVLMGPGKDLAFLLADAGYDVWLNNVRGNSYSRSHVVLSPENPAFWQFSHHDVGYYDLPAVIDYVLEKTGQKNLTYIGHSMGTTAIYILLSTRPEYNKRLRVVVSLAPVAYWRHKLVGLQKLGADNGFLIEEILRSRGIYELIPQSSMNSRLAKALCSSTSVTQPTCVNIIFALAGADHQQLNTSLIPYISAYFPAGGSLKTVMHYFQSAVTGTFRQYDYGYVENFRHYQQKDPPAYDVSKVTAPVALFYGRKDTLSTAEDVKELRKRLPNVVMSAEVPHESFNHIDFLWANDANKILYEDVMNLIHQFK